jgi:hypothetical protein
MIMAIGAVVEKLLMSFSPTEGHSCADLIPLGCLALWLTKMEVYGRRVSILTVVLEHCPDAATVLREVRRDLRPNGFLFLTVPFVWPIH